MGLLNEVVATGGRDDLDVLHSVEHRELAQSRTVTPELVGVDDGWDIELTQEPSEEGPHRLRVTVSLKEDIKHSTLPIHGPPQPVNDAAYVHVP